MDKKLKAKWVMALRSGRYKQTNGALHDTKGYCCLGVLCAVQGARWPADGNGDLIPHIGGKDATLRGFEYLAAFARGCMRDSTQKKLATLNDNGSSFKDIADYISKKL